MVESCEESCKPCEGGVTAMSSDQIQKSLAHLTGWNYNEFNAEIYKIFSFKGYYKTIVFVNAVAWVANQLGHHPDLEVAYNSCKVRYTTHAIKALSKNDFVCAAQIDKLITK